jgi:hypothetical protein
MIVETRKGIYHLALDKIMAEEEVVKAKEMEVLVEKQNMINEMLRNILDVDEIESEISDEGTIEIDGVTFTLDYLVENNGLVLKAEITCTECGEILEYKTIYSARDIVDVFKVRICSACLDKKTAERERLHSFWWPLNLLFRRR